MFLNCSTCFGRHTAHHQELKNSNCSLWFYIRFSGCRPLLWLSHRSGRQPKKYVKPEAAITVFELLMMGGVSPETCWAINKNWNNKFYYTVSSCCSFYELYELHYVIKVNSKTKNTYWTPEANLFLCLELPLSKITLPVRGMFVKKNRRLLLSRKNKKKVSWQERA
jgi:hypothetical protein